jgi:hypothetical protein
LPSLSGCAPGGFGWRQRRPELALANGPAMMGHTHALGRWAGWGNEWGSWLGWLEGEPGFQPNAGLGIGNSFDFPNLVITSKLI